MILRNYAAPWRTTHECWLVNARTKQLRRAWAQILIGCAVAVMAGKASDDRLLAAPATESSKILFTSGGKIGVIGADGGRLRWLEFNIPNQATWQAPDFFADGQLLLLSMEPRRDGPSRPFEEYYTQTPTHLWRYSLDRAQLEELATEDRIAPFYAPMLLVGDDRILVQVVKNRIGQIYSMKLDGSDAREFTRADEGLPYGFSLSPDGRRVAFHLAGPQGYQVWTSNTDGTHRVRIAAATNHLYFGTTWSPDGRWIAYHDCHHRDDPGHDWSDLCIGRADGSEHRVLTTNQSQWFGATYGPPGAPGGGSNLPVWTPAGKIVFSKRLPNSKVPWQYQAQQRDIDHFNRDYNPAAARGGTVICQLDPRTGKSISLTQSDPPVWDFRAQVSPDGQRIAFCRAATGEATTLWVISADGSNPRQIATGRDGHGVEHPQWIAQAEGSH